jgi:periplasmic copper chaperone A
MTHRRSPLRRLVVGLLIAAPVGLVGLAAAAHEFTLGSLTIGHPYARPTVPGQVVGGGFMSIANKGADDRLLSATSPSAKGVELHSMSMDGDVMRMRQIDGIAVPAGKTVDLKPGALHLMFMGLKAPLKAGDKLPVTLKFAKAGEIVVTFNVAEPAP